MTGGGGGRPVDEHASNLDRHHSWPKAVFFASGIALSVCVDILQYSMPLAFIPSRLEDTGYSNFQIAAAVGVYYWTGFGVTCIIASYHIFCVLTEKEGERGVTNDAQQIRRHIVYALAALSGGTVTLFAQGLYPTYHVHLGARFIQGGCGGVIFIFSFLTACSLFKGNQQVFSLTMCSVMFNVAEVLGPYCGAIVHDYLGLSAVFYLLGTFSFFCQIWFLAIIVNIREKDEVSGDSQILPTSISGHPTLASKEIGWPRLKSLLSSRRFLISVLLISTAAMIKGGVEECLPFHADHEWRKTPMEIGEFFSVIALAYLGAAAMVGQLWSMWPSGGAVRVGICAFMLSMLGLSTLALFSIKSYGFGSGTMWGALSAYGFFLGVTFTPATLLLGDAVENEDPGVAKDATNSMWNMMWEAGGSIGFLIGGVFAHTYKRQIRLFSAFAVIAILVSILVIIISMLPEQSKNYVKRRREPSKLSGSAHVASMSESLKAHHSNAQTA